MTTFILVLAIIILLPFALQAFFRILFSWQLWALVGAAWPFINYASHEGERMGREERAHAALATPTPRPTRLDPEHPDLSTLAATSDEENEDNYGIIQGTVALTSEEKQRILQSPSGQIMVRRHNEYVAQHGGDDYIPRNPFTARPFDNN
jgi:hypothetical protein